MQNNRTWEGSLAGIDAVNEGDQQSDTFRMFCFKIRTCPMKTQHPWESCAYAHPNENARRRDPRLYKYIAEPCPDYKSGICFLGNRCPYAHGVYERNLHPSKYRTQICTEGQKCSRRVCFFAHTQDELRTPQYVWFSPEQAAEYRRKYLDEFISMKQLPPSSNMGEHGLTPDLLLRQGLMPSPTDLESQAVSAAFLAQSQLHKGPPSSPSSSFMSLNSQGQGNSPKSILAPITPPSGPGRMAPSSPNGGIWADMTPSYTSLGADAQADSSLFPVDMAGKLHRNNMEAYHESTRGGQQVNRGHISQPPFSSSSGLNKQSLEQRMPQQSEDGPRMSMKMRRILEKQDHDDIQHHHSPIHVPSLQLHNLTDQGTSAGLLGLTFPQSNAFNITPRMTPRMHTHRQHINDHLQHPQDLLHGMSPALDSFLGTPAPLLFAGQLGNHLSASPYPLLGLQSGMQGPASVLNMEHLVPPEMLGSMALQEQLQHLTPNVQYHM